MNAINPTNPTNLKVVPNNLKTGEAGKVGGVKQASNEIVAGIDFEKESIVKNRKTRFVERTLERQSD